MAADSLADVLRAEEVRARDIMHRMRDIDTATHDADVEGTILSAIESLRMTAELVGCLRRLVDGRTAEEIHRAFGAPGDFGYERPLGQALYRLYCGKAVSQ